MNQIKRNNIEKVKAPEAKSAPKETRSPELNKTLSATAGEAMGPGVEAASLGAEMSEVISDPEKVREAGESTSENKAFTFKKKKDDKGAKRQTAAQVKQTLLASAPAEQKMRKQIASEIRSEIWWLHRRSFFITIGLKKGSDFEMNNIVKKIRELKALLSRLASITAEVLKALWLRFVHGII